MGSAGARKGNWSPSKPSIKSFVGTKDLIDDRDLEKKPKEKKTSRQMDWWESFGEAALKTTTEGTNASGVGKKKPSATGIPGMLRSIAGGGK